MLVGRVGSVAYQCDIPGACSLGLPVSASWMAATVAVAAAAAVAGTMASARCT